MKCGPTYVFVGVQRPDGVAEEQYLERRRDLLKDAVLASLIDTPTSQVIIGVSSERGTFPPKSYDFSHFNVAEDANQETLMADARACWEQKRRFFATPRRRLYDERDIPPTE